MRFAVDAYLHLCASRPLTEAIASSLTELFAPTIMADRMRCWKSTIRGSTAAALEYFRGRLVQAPRDSEFGLQYVVAHCVTRESQDSAAEALTLKCHILWGAARRDPLRIRFAGIFAAAVARSAETLMSLDRPMAAAAG